MKTAEIPLTELTTAQLIKHVGRLDDQIRLLTLRTGEEILRENEKLRTSNYQQGYVIDQICRTLHCHGFETPDDKHIWSGVSMLGQRMKAAEDELAALESQPEAKG